MSNLGYKLMEVGFFDEAKVEFERALNIGDFHKNVGQGLATLKSAPEREEEKETEILNAAAEKAAFYRALGRAVASRSVFLKGMWKAPNCELDVAASEGTFSAKGEYESKNYLLQGLAGMSAVPTVHHFIEYKGKIDGRRIEGSVIRTTNEKPKTSSLLGGGGDSENFLMVVDESGQFIEVAEKPRSKKPTFYKITALS